MAEPPPDAVASRVLAAFNGAGASLSSIWRDDCDGTTMRVRTVATDSLQATRRALAAALPLARVSLGTCPLDGEVEAEICVPTAREEAVLARRLVRQRWPLRLARYLGYALLLAGVLRATSCSGPGHSGTIFKG